MARNFPYAERAERARLAQQVHKVSARSPLLKDRKANLAAFWAALEVVVPATFDEDYERLKAGDPSAADTAIEFLEADPIFFRSGYLKADLARFLNRTPLSFRQKERLRAAVLYVTASRYGREFRRYCQLARKLDGPLFRSRLEHLATTGATDVRRRAGWVLQALGPGVGTADPNPSPQDR